jgi:predicted amidophosphoribosyltransferase
VEVVQALSRRASAGEQSGRSQRQRLLGRDGTTTVRKPVSAPVLLVDDVLTTGATLLDAERALAGAGSLTLGALVLAVTRAESASV